MIGVGFAEQAGLRTALIKKIVQITPPKLDFGHFCIGQLASAGSR